MSNALPIVFIPGASSDDTVWDAQKNHFAATREAITVSLVDLDNISDMSDRVLAAVKGDFIICGTSMGGYVALDVLKKAKQRIKKVIFCCTSARADTLERAAQRMAEIALGEQAYVEARKDDRHYRGFIGPKYWNNTELIRSLRDVSQRVGFGCFSRHQTACANRADSVPFLEKIDIPALVISGEKDILIPYALQKEMHDHLPQSTLVSIPDAGHIAHIEDAERVTAAIEEFLKD